jgi:hypothetical protein
MELLSVLLKCTFIYQSLKESNRKLISSNGSLLVVGLSGCLSAFRVFLWKVNENFIYDITITRQDKLRQY